MERETWSGREGDPIWKFCCFDESLHMIDPETLESLGWIKLHCRPPNFIAIGAAIVQRSHDAMLFTNGFDVLEHRLSTGTTTLVDSGGDIVKQIIVSASGATVATRRLCHKQYWEVCGSHQTSPFQPGVFVEVRDGEAVVSSCSLGRTQLRLKRTQLRAKRVSSLPHIDGGTVFVTRCHEARRETLWLVTKVRPNGDIEYDVPVASAKGGVTELVVNGQRGWFDLLKADGRKHSPKWLIGVSQHRGFVLVGAGNTVLKILVPDGLRMHFIRAVVGAVVDP